MPKSGDFRIALWYTGIQFLLEFGVSYGEEPTKIAVSVDVAGKPRMF